MTEQTSGTVPDTTPVNIEWGLQAGDATRQQWDELLTRLGEATAENPVAFSLLPLKAVQAVYTALGLNRGLRFEPGVGEDHSNLARRSTDAPVRYLNPQSAPRASSFAASVHSETSATFSRTLHELRDRCVLSAHRSAAFEGFGIENTFRFQKESLKQEEHQKIYLLEQTLVPKVTLAFEPEEDLGCAPQFKAAVEKLLHAGHDREAQYEMLHRDVLRRFGYFFPCEVTLGGKWSRSLEIEYKRSIEQDQMLVEMGLAGKADVETGSGRVTADMGFGSRVENLEKYEQIQELRKQAIHALGGATSVAMSENKLAEWVKSVGSIKRWAVIDNARLVPVLRFLPPELARQCYSLIRQFARSKTSRAYTVLDMVAYANAGSELVPELM